MFYKNSQRLNTVNYICEKLNIRCFIEFWVRLWLSSGFFYYYKLRLLFWILQDLSNLMRILFNPLTGAIIIRSSGFFIVNLEHVFFFFLSGFSFTNIHDSRDSRGRGHLDISRVITAESSPLHIAGSRTRTGNLWFPSANR